MFNGNEKNKQIVKLVLRVVVAGYIGFLGGQLIVRRPPGSSPWFMVAAVFFIVVAVGFTIFSIIMFFRERAALAEETEDEEVAPPANRVEENRPGGFSIRDMARYQSKEDEDAGSDNDGRAD